MAPVHMAWADILSVICTIPNAFRRRETHPFFLVPVLAFLLAMFVWLLPWQPEMFVWLVVCRHPKWWRHDLGCACACRWHFSDNQLIAGCSRSEHLLKKRLTSGERMCLNGCLLFQDGCFSADYLEQQNISVLLLISRKLVNLPMACVCYHWEPRSSWRLAQHGGIICLVPASRSWCTGRILLLGRSTGLDQDIRSRCFLPILRGVQQIP